MHRRYILKYSYHKQTELDLELEIENFILQGL